jgi:hypothetical protein
MKKKSKAKSLARGDSFAEIAGDGFSDTDQEGENVENSYDPEAPKTPFRQKSIVGKDASV